MKSGEMSASEWQKDGRARKALPPPTSQSRNVNAYVKAQARYLKLEARLQKQEAALMPLRRKTDSARYAAKTRYAKLTGSQIAEASRLLKGS